MNELGVILFYTECCAGGATPSLITTGPEAIPKPGTISSSPPVA